MTHKHSGKKWTQALIKQRITLPITQLWTDKRSPARPSNSIDVILKPTTAPHYSLQLILNSGRSCAGVNFRLACARKWVFSSPNKGANTEREASAGPARRAPIFPQISLSEGVEQCARTTCYLRKGWAVFAPISTHSKREHGQWPNYALRATHTWVFLRCGRREISFPCAQLPACGTFPYATRATLGLLAEWNK
jgi:hypothetical protein